MSTTARSAPPTSLGRLDRYFRLTERGSTVGSEIRGGLATFFAMAYVLVVNAGILSGPDSTGAYLGGGTSPNIPAIAAATALVAGIMTILMGVAANYPLALAAGMGINALLAFTVVQLPGMTWADGMGLVVLEGLVILILVLTGLRAAVFKAVPHTLKVAISVGIGLFIALVGLVNAGIVRPGGTPLQLGINGSLAGWPALVFVFGLFLIAVLMVRKVRGAILIGIVAAAVLAAIIEAVAHVGAKSDANPAGWALSAPTLTGSPVQLPDFSHARPVLPLRCVREAGAARGDPADLLDHARRLLRHDGHDGRHRRRGEPARRGRQPARTPATSSSSTPSPRPPVVPPASRRTPATSSPRPAWARARAPVCRPSSPAWRSSWRCSSRRSWPSCPSRRPAPPSSSSASS